jgi:hypothetical protein
LKMNEDDQVIKFPSDGSGDGDGLELTAS